MNRNNLGALIAFGLVGLNGFMLGKLSSPMWQDVEKLEEQVSNCQEAYMSVLKRHDAFLQQMPNYDPYCLWLDGNSCESWMIEDINARYKSEY